MQILVVLLQQFLISFLAECLIGLNLSAVLCFSSPVAASSSWGHNKMDKPSPVQQRRRERQCIMWLCACSTSRCWPSATSRKHQFMPTPCFPYNGYRCFHGISCTSQWFCMVNSFLCQFPFCSLFVSWPNNLADWSQGVTFFVSLTRCFREHSGHQYLYPVDAPLHLTFRVRLPLKFSSSIQSSWLGTCNGLFFQKSVQF